MTFSQCTDRLEFTPNRLVLGDNKFFNRLLGRTTKLTTPSVVCYCYTGKDEVDRTHVKSIEKIFLSENPSKDIEDDKELIKEKEVDEILIMQNSENLDDEEVNQTLSDKERKHFESVIKEVEKFYACQ